MTEESTAAWEAILRAHAHLVPRLERAVFTRTGVTLTVYDVLLELSNAGGRLTMGELGDRVVLSRTRVSRVVDEMVAAGLVAREANTNDGRSAYAVITTEGRKKFLAAAKAYVPAIETELSSIDDRTLGVIARGLNKLRDSS